MTNAATPAGAEPVVTGQPQKPEWQYDPGEHRTKHCWGRPEAGFATEGNTEIGKCASGISPELAKTLVNSGIPLDEHDPPRKIVNVHEGVIYLAVPTQPGVSYHGYPWRYRPGAHRLSRAVMDELRRRAVATGHEKPFDDWVKRYG